MSIRLEHLNYVYSLGTAYEKHALKDISLTIPHGEFVGIIGHTGSGKSTLIQHLNGLIKATSGALYYNDENDEVKTCLETLSAKGEIPSLRFTAGDTSQSGNRGDTRPFRDSEPVTSREEQQPCREVPVSPIPPSSREAVSQARRREPAIVTVRCRSCGAMAQLRQGEVVECEHCGNKLTL